MRIGEFGRQLNEYLKNGQIQIHAKDADDGYNRHYLKSVKSLRQTLNFLNEQKWLTGYVNPQLTGILSNYGVNEDTILLNNSDYTKVVNSIQALNTILSLTNGILDDFSPKQDEQVINVKLPTQIKSIEDLQEFNSRLQNELKIFNITGQFEVTGFDRGSEWYEIYINTVPLYKYFVAVLGLALTIVTLRKKFFESEIAKINLRMLKRKEYEVSEEEQKNELTQMVAEEEAPKIVKQLGATDNKTNNEMNTMVIKAATALVAELEQGTEFHLSLSPPEYLRQSDGPELSIDYKSIPPLDNKSTSPKKLNSGDSKPTL